MKPLGQRPIKFPGKQDCHPQKGYVNWWENDLNESENKPLEKREVKKEIQEELINMYEN